VVIRLNRGPIALELDPEDGARIISCTWLGLQLVAERREGDFSWGWFAMAPWAGRVRNGLITTPSGDVQLPKERSGHSMHGFASRVAWKVEYQDETRCTLVADTPEPYLGGVMRQEIELGHLAIHWTITYIGGAVMMPAWVGLHPWFRRRLSRGEPAIVEFEAARMLELDSEGLPTGRSIDPTTGPHDDAFTSLTGAPSVYWPGALRLMIESISPWWVIYDKEAGSLCIEPQSSPPDAANLALAPVVAEGEEVSVSATFRIVPD
jgi:aldose 1-epimerase